MTRDTQVNGPFSMPMTARRSQTGRATTPRSPNQNPDSIYLSIYKSKVRKACLPEVMLSLLMPITVG